MQPSVVGPPVASGNASSAVNVRPSNGRTFIKEKKLGATAEPNTRPEKSSSPRLPSCRESAQESSEKKSRFAWRASNSTGDKPVRQGSDVLVLLTHSPISTSRSDSGPGTGLNR